MRNVIQGQSIAELRNSLIRLSHIKEYILDEQGLEELTKIRNSIKASILLITKL